VKIGGFRPSNLLGARINTPIGDVPFQNAPRCMSKFCERGLRDVEKSVEGVSELEFNVPFQHKHGYIRDEIGGGKKLNEITRPKHISLPLSRATVISTFSQDTVMRVMRHDETEPRQDI